MLFHFWGGSYLLAKHNMLLLLSWLYAPVTVQKHAVFCKQQLPPQKWKSMSHISDPMPKKKVEVCSKTWKKAKVWRLAKKYVEQEWEEQGINLNASNMCWQMGEDLTN